MTFQYLRIDYHIESNEVIPSIKILDGISSKQLGSFTMNKISEADIDQHRREFYNYFFGKVVLSSNSGVYDPKLKKLVEYDIEENIFIDVKEEP